MPLTPPNNSDAKPDAKPEANGSGSTPAKEPGRWSSERFDPAKVRSLPLKVGGKSAPSAPPAADQGLAATVTADFGFALNGEDKNAPATTESAAAESAPARANGESTSPHSASAPQSADLPKRATAMQMLAALERSRGVSLKTAAASWLTSALVNMAALLLIAWLRFGADVAAPIVSLISPQSDSVTNPESLEESAPTIEHATDTLTELTPNDSETTEGGEVDLADLTDTAAAGLESPELDAGLAHAVTGDLLSRVDSGFGGTGLSGRSEGARKQLVAQAGGTDASEAAVALALKWLAAHQSKDGSWSFDHRSAACSGRCKNPGAFRNRTVAATAMGVLPFLGAGQTHKEGQYRLVVERALYFLTANMVDTPQGGDLTQPSVGGQMYDHGLASIALCEAFAMTQDKNLYPYAQAALNFIVFAQDDVHGGWRYSPNAGGDTSVVGWQLMALKSGSMAGLSVPIQSYRGAWVYLNEVQSLDGAAYGYDRPGSSSATNAIGLLCRMYLGWKRDEPALREGVKSLLATGPIPNNMYYNYYATQVMHHYGGDEWNAWNEKMREQLIEQQEQSGHAAGSWFNCTYGGVGGRLLCTSLSCMTLEVYYRHMPLYNEASTDDDMEGLGE